MPLRNTFPATPREVYELFPVSSQPLIEKKAADLLQSRLIDAFETALCQGMQPMDALAVMVSWMAFEMMRVQAD